MTIPEISPYLPTYTNRNQAVNPVPPVTNAPFIQKRSVEYVKGYEGAQNFMMAANSSALALDEEMNVLWVIATDQNGSKSVIKGYKIGDEYTPPKPATLDDLLEQMRNMNERLNRMEEREANGQHDRGSSGQSKPDGADDAAGSRTGTEYAVRKSYGNAGKQQSSDAAGL